MKKVLRLLLPFLLLMLCACGGDMTGWPTLELNLEIENYDEVSLEYHHISKPSDRRPLDVDEDYFGTSANREIINEIYQQIDGSLYSEETYDKIDTENYWSKVVITFWKDGEAGYTFTYYEYAIKDGYFVFDGGEIHKYLGAFVHGTYERFKDELETQSDV